MQNLVAVSSADKNDTGTVNKLFLFFIRKYAQSLSQFVHSKVTVQRVGTQERALLAKHHPDSSNLGSPQHYLIVVVDRS